jgi:transcriptional regulator with XRE-family HTH domain
VLYTKYGGCRQLMYSPLKRARERRGWTQEHVAAGVNLHLTTYCKIENGAATTKDKAREIAEFFGREVIEQQILYPEDYLPREAEEAKAS